MNKVIRYCQYCGEELTSDQRHNLYCSQNCANQAKKENNIQLWKDGYISGTNKNGQISPIVRNYMLKKANYCCEICGWNKVNQTLGYSPLEIHHKDGNYNNNDEDNLQVLCPNCHSLTANYRALNTGGREQRKNSIKKNYCIDCGVEILNGSIRCHKCEGKHRKTEKPISREELKKMIRNTSFVEIGRQFNVTDNTIRKWCDSYNLPRRVHDIKQYSDIEWEQI